MRQSIRIRQALLAATGLVATFCLVASARAGTGSILGTVIDERGSPVAGVEVTARPTGHPLLTLISLAYSDAQGHFSISKLGWGKYRICTSKLASGYPNTAFSSFYHKVYVPEVTLTPAAPSVEVRVRLGAKAGILSGITQDAVTGAPVNATIKLIRADSPGDWLSTSQPPNYRVLLPIGSAVLVHISGEGYKTWRSVKPLVLSSGQERHLDVALEPVQNPNLPLSEFLIPDGYIGWIQLECNVKDARSTQAKNGIRVFKFPQTGILATSSGVPEQAGEKRYFYVTAQGTLRDVLMQYKSGHGLVWGASYGSVHGRMSEFYFFVGTEEEFKKRGYRGLSSVH